MAGRLSSSMASLARFLQAFLEGKSGNEDAISGKGEAKDMICQTGEDISTSCLTYDESVCPIYDGF